MLKQALSEIATFVFQQNPYFVEAYDDVYLSENGVVHNDDYVFPADNKGDYFYLRLPQNVSFVYSSEYQVSDCMTSAGVRASVILVACVKEADGDGLLQNLVSSLANFGKYSIRLQSAIYQPEYVVLQELGRLEKDEQQAALQRLDPDYTIVSITFQIEKFVPVNRINCNNKPCPSC